QNARHERMHRTLKEEVCREPSKSFAAQKKRIQRFVEEFNEERPHQALGNRTPSEVYVPSMKTYSRKNAEHGFPKFGLNYTLVDRQGVAEFNSSRIEIGKALANEIVDVYPNGKRKWVFAFGPVVLG